MKYIVYYLDNFLVLGSPQSDECKSALSILTNCCDSLEVPLAVEKLEGPATCLQFLGFELDTERMEIR